jgi:hypothetical protein
MPERYCQYDVSVWPSHGYLSEYDPARCCGKAAVFTLPTEEEYPNRPALKVWVCAEHYDEWFQVPC